MKLLNNILKFLVILILLAVGILFILANSTFGDYNTTTYDLIINPILFLNYILFSFIVYYWTRKKIKHKKIYVLLVIPMVIVCLSIINGKNIHKKTILIGKIDNYPSTSIKFFENQTFEIKIQYPHVTEFKKGKFEKKDNEFRIIRTDIEEVTDSIYTNKYLIKNDSIFEPVNRRFKKITAYNNGYAQSKK